MADGLGEEGVRVQEWTDSRRGSESDWDTQEAAALAGGSPPRVEGRGAVVVVFLSQVIPRDSCLLSFPF